MDTQKLVDGYVDTVGTETLLENNFNKLSVHTPTAKCDHMHNFKNKNRSM